MTNIRLEIRGLDARAFLDGPLTSGAVGVGVRLSYDAGWAGLTKTLVCRNGAVTRVVLGVEDSAVVPPEVLCNAEGGGGLLWMGVEGRKGDGTLVFPTTFALVGPVHPGAVAEGDPSVSPENPAWAQVIGSLGSLEALETAHKENLVAAINEVRSQGGHALTQGDKEEIAKSALPLWKKNISWLDGYDIPKLYLTGDTTGMTKQNKVTLAWRYGENAGSCTLKWQGNSSLAFAKKNYTIKLDKAIDIGFGAQSKYCLKANYMDHSHARNIVSARLWGQIVKSRKSVPAQMAASPNYGAVDGFPVVIVLNGAFHGLYTFNIPKDAWMMGMGSGTKEAILCADKYTDATKFKGTALCDGSDFELEYVTDEGNSQWVATSLNTLIQACMDSDGANLDAVLPQYVDWESAIDYYIWVAVVLGTDMYNKNYILATYDGTKWYFSAYDMDCTYGMKFDASYMSRADYGVYTSFEGFAGVHRLMELIKLYKKDALRTRYQALRKDILAESNMVREFEKFGGTIPTRLLEEDRNVWPMLPLTNVSNTAQIAGFITRRLAVVDRWMEALTGASTPTTPDTPVAGYTNQVPLSTDASGNVFNGTGYQDGYRLSSSSGNTSAQEGSTVTGFIPFKMGNVLRMKGVLFGSTDQPTVSDGYVNVGHYCNVCMYDSSKSKVDCLTYNAYKSAMNNNQTQSGIYNAIAYDSATGVTEITLDRMSGITTTAYIRINAHGNGADMIVTVDQEIP